VAISRRTFVSTSVIAAGQRHDLVRGEAARCRAAHAFEAVRRRPALADSAEKRPAVFGDLEIHLVARFDAEAITHTLRDRYLALARPRNRHPNLRNTRLSLGITYHGTGDAASVAASCRNIVPTQGVDRSSILPCAVAVATCGRSAFAEASAHSETLSHARRDPSDH